ncbi:hypothetical protein A3J13_00695 [Candidatus Daviesbacteria bacterium RIFCSPLOWO2_02_FULL_36_8]|uniref:Uncharacterized protein n=1 Tax=Candidatus Daviesbacteria bacterium RIFCSPLOWO2_02_FULL_36_8 TaxID=1797793 RepID=A0A1F5MFH7_9BACT|nr:MAG: hypothetical protein A3J13_00695 [Candidatus Daviesbacteria bacterium RIFCSPLOWO2_02_FULL_36_8]
MTSERQLTASDHLNTLLETIARIHAPSTTLTQRYGLEKGLLKTVRSIPGAPGIEEAATKFKGLMHSDDISDHNRAWEVYQACSRARMGRCIQEIFDINEDDLNIISPRRFRARGLQ